MLSVNRIIWAFILLTTIRVAALGQNAESAYSVKIQISGVEGRRVFRRIETINILAELQGNGEIPCHFQGEIRGQMHIFFRTLEFMPLVDGKTACEVDLSEFKVGPYEVIVRLVSDMANQVVAQARLEFHILERPTELDFLPVSTQFSPVPSGKGWKGEGGPLSEEVMRETIDNIIEHGFTGLQAPTHRPKEEESFILNYAQSRGMVITYHTGALELFGRSAPPKICVYSPEYAKAVRSNAEQRLAPLKDIPRLYNVFTFQDEPFHEGPKSFGYNDEVKAEFRKRYGYDLPPDLDSIQDNSKKWLDVINFRSDYFPDGWRQVYKIIKVIDPSFKTVLTHDSDNTIGGGCTSHAEIAIDDIFHWGGDFSDIFVFDTYPYMMNYDHRFGEPSKLLKPRVLHYSWAHNRNLTRVYNKPLGSWVATYNPAISKGFLSPKLEANYKAQYWSEREMSTTAVAQGANFLLTLSKLPTDARHWESFGEGLRLIQKAGNRLLKAPKVKAKACMLFPRTHYIQLQEEYFNVGLSFELFLRSFGELDILHEEQVTDDELDGYKILVLFDVKLLPKKVAENIASFVRKGGIVIADCVPQMDAYKEPMEIMENLFGVTNAETVRIKRMGHWFPKEIIETFWLYRPKDAPDESVFTTDKIQGAVLGQNLDLTLVSPRPCKVTTGKVLIETTAGQPGVIHRKVGKGQVFLLGFCLQDTYFKTWQDENEVARGQLRSLLRVMTENGGVRPHVYSSNPDIEAAVRANEREGFLFVINHEAEEADTAVLLAELDFEIGRIINLADGRAVRFRNNNGQVELQINAPIGETRLFHIKAKESKSMNLPESLPGNIRVVLENTEPLRFPRGDRLPLYVWPIMGRLSGLDDAQAEQVIKLLNERGIAMCVNWSIGAAKEKSLAEGLRIGAIQQKLGLRVNVNANACLHSFFNGDERTFHIDEDGKKFYDDSFGGRKMGCPFALKFRYPAMKEQVEYFLRGHKEKGINVDFIFADWEIDGPIEWNDAWANSKKCKRCRENIKNIDDFREFQKQLRLIRCDMQRVVFAENVKAYFPNALVGNYAIYPHDGYRYWYDYFEKPIVEGMPYKADQRAKYRQWFQEFEPTGYTFAMPTVYTWYATFDWYDFENSDYRWFYNMLLVASNAGEHTPRHIPIISFVHWTTTAPPKDPDPKVKQFSREKYQELLWHMLLRGTDGLFLWCPQGELTAEIQPLHKVYAAALQYKDFFDKGEPISFEVPKRPGPVISGLKLGNKVLLRRTDFNDTSGTVTLRVENQKLKIPRAEGKCQVLELK